jgi:hypothetical protein
MEADATSARHGHDRQDEEICIIGSDLMIGALTSRTGDFHLSGASRVHPGIRSRAAVSH